MKLVKRLPLDAACVAIDEETGVIQGYGSIFGNKDQGGDIVVKGAFSNTLKERPSIKMFWGHDEKSVPIGVWEEAKEDAKGLMMKGRLFLDTERGREVHVALKNGAIDGLSIGYSIVKSKNTKAGFELLELKLFEVSVVNFPMNEQATVETVKSISDAGGKKRFLEGILRDAGLSVKQAKHGASMLVDEVLIERDARNTTAEMADDLKRFIAELSAT